MNTNTLSERIKGRLDALSHKPAALAAYCKVSRSAVSKWLNNPSVKIEGENLLKAAEFLECDPEWLATGKGFWNYSNSTGYEVHTFDEKELLDLVIGTSDIKVSISTISYTQDQYSLVFGNRKPSSLRITNLKADNMSGSLEPGDLVFIDVTITKYDGDGIYLFVFGNHLHLKRLQMVGSNLLVISDNKQYQTWEIAPKSREKFKVVGKILLSQSQVFQRF